MLITASVSFFVASFFLLMQAFLLYVCFSGVRGQAWSELTSCPRAAACVIRAGPYLFWISRICVFIALVAAGALYWGVGACVRA